MPLLAPNGLSVLVRCDRWHPCSGGFDCAHSPPAVLRTDRQQPEHGCTDCTVTTRICSACATSTVQEYFNESVSDANGSFMRRFSESTWAVLLLLGVSAVSVTQQVRETFFYSNGREAFESEPLLSLPAAFVGQSVRIVDALPHLKDWPENRQSAEASVLVNDTVVLAPGMAEVRAGRDDLGRYHRWITVQRFTEKTTNRSFLLIGRLRSPASRLEVDLVSIQSDGTRSMRSISSDDRGESYPVHRVLAALGDESLAVYPFQFWSFLPVLLLPLTGPWIGLGASLVVLGIKAATGRWNVGSPLNK